MPYYDRFPEITQETRGGVDRILVGFTPLPRAKRIRMASLFLIPILMCLVLAGLMPSHLRAMADFGPPNPGPGVETFEMIFVVMHVIGVLGALATAAGFACVIYCFCRPGKPEIYELAEPNLIYDSGVEPVLDGNWKDPDGHYQPKGLLPLPKRTRRTFTPHQLETLTLWIEDEGTRLIMDADGARYDLSPAATDSQRRWIFRQLARRYRVGRIVDMSATTPQRRHSPGRHSDLREEDLVHPMER